MGVCHGPSFPSFPLFVSKEGIPVGNEHQGRGHSVTHPPLGGTHWGFGGDWEREIRADFFTFLVFLAPRTPLSAFLGCGLGWRGQRGAPGGKWGCGKHWGDNLGGELSELGWGPDPGPGGATRKGRSRRNLGVWPVPGWHGVTGQEGSALAIPGLMISKESSSFSLLRAHGPGFARRGKRRGSSGPGGAEFPISWWDGGGRTACLLPGLGWGQNLRSRPAEGAG